MKKNARHFVMFCLVCVLACSCVWAFPGRVKIEDPLPVIPEVPEIQSVIPVITLPEETPVMEEPEAMPSVQEQPPVSETMPDEGLMQLLDLLETFENASKLNKDELGKLISELEVIKTEYELIVQDVEEKEHQIDDLKTLHAAQLDELAVINGKQADDLAYLRGMYDQETKAKLTAKVGAVLGFEEDMTPTYGVSGALGGRFGKGFLVEAGAQYMIGSFKNPLFMPSMENLQLTTSIGWEW